MKEMTEAEVLVDIRGLFPTEEMYREFLLFRRLNDEKQNQLIAASKERVRKLSLEEQEQHSQNLTTGLLQAIDYCAEIKLMQQLGAIPEYVSLSKIAKKHFGKSSGWLYHRLKGTLINGKPACFTNEQRLKLAGAFDELAQDFNNASQMLRAIPA